MCEPYNGWSNYETWGVHLILTNAEHSQRYWEDAAREAKLHALSNLHETWCSMDHARYDLADRLKGEVETMCENYHDTIREARIFTDLCGGSMMLIQLLGAALSHVNWDEIAKAFLEE